MSEYIKKIAQIKNDIMIIQDAVFFELNKLEEENKETRKRAIDIIKRQHKSKIGIIKAKNEVITTLNNICKNEIRKLEQENKILRDALAFYGDKDNWRDIIEEEAYGNVSGLCAGVFDSIIYEDCDDTETGGKLARQTLAQLSVEKER